MIKQYLNKFLHLTTSAVLSVLLVGSMMLALAPAITSAADAPCTGTAQQCAQQGVGLTTNSSGSVDVGALISTAINILSLIVGAAAIIMIIVGGLRFVISGGDASATTSARNTVLYALIGLVVAALAQVMVHYVLSKTVHP